MYTYNWETAKHTCLCSFFDTFADIIGDTLLPICAIAFLHGIINILTTEGAVGSEVFDGFVLVTEAEAKEIIKKGRDSYDNFFSVYTWCVLMYFVSGMWKQN